MVIEIDVSDENCKNERDRKKLDRKMATAWAKLHREYPAANISFSQANYPGVRIDPQGESVDASPIRTKIKEVLAELLA